MRTAKDVGLALLLVILPLGTRALGQGAVAFAPVVGMVPDGAILNVTPVVSADRRYVRLSVSPTFIGFIEFDTILVPAAVSGGGNGTFGGLGGGGGGGLRNVFGNRVARRPSAAAATDLMAVARMSPQSVADAPDAIPTVVRRPARRRPTLAVRAGTPGPEARAATILRMGQSLERAGHVAGAVGYYRDLIAKHPQSPHARTARARLAALTAAGDVD